jgi:catechol 2,3-dioxygenase-like lactoylglutathione lyase family enzyme
MIRGLGHLCFVAKDLEASIEFYRDALGMAPAFDFINENGERYGIYLHAGGRNFIEIFQGDPSKRDDSQSYRHFCLEVEDIEGTTAAIREHGVEVTPVKMGKDHSWQAWLEDPDGNRIELHEYTDKSKQNVSL